MPLRTPGRAGLGQPTAAANSRTAEVTALALCDLILQVRLGSPAQRREDQDATADEHDIRR
jgi:hypothetical protein